MMWYSWDLILERLFEVRLGGAADDARLAFVQPLVAVAQVALDVRVWYLAVYAVHSTGVGDLQHTMTILPHLPEHGNQQSVYNRHIFIMTRKEIINVSIVQMANFFYNAQV